MSNWFSQQFPNDMSSTSDSESKTPSRQFFRQRLQEACAGLSSTLYYCRALRRASHPTQSVGEIPPGFSCYAHVGSRVQGHMSQGSRALDAILCTQGGLAGSLDRDTTCLAVAHVHQRSVRLYSVVPLLESSPLLSYRVASQKHGLRLLWFS